VSAMTWVAPFNRVPIAHLRRHYSCARAVLACGGDRSIDKPLARLAPVILGRYRYSPRSGGMSSDRT
jgi:hypothetical protein